MRLDRASRIAGSAAPASSAPIQRFGSIIVNDARIGYRADVLVDIDGEARTARDLRIGQVVRAVARSREGGLSTRLPRIEGCPWPEVVGRIENLSDDAMDVLGQRIILAGFRNPRHGGAKGARVLLSAVCAGLTARSSPALSSSFARARGSIRWSARSKALRAPNFHRRSQTCGGRCWPDRQTRRACRASDDGRLSRHPQPARRSAVRQASRSFVARDPSSAASARIFCLGSGLFDPQFCPRRRKFLRTKKPGRLSTPQSTALVETSCPDDPARRRPGRRVGAGRSRARRAGAGLCGSGAWRRSIGARIARRLGFGSGRQRWRTWPRDGPPMTPGFSAGDCGMVEIAPTSGLVAWRRG